MLSKSSAMTTSLPMVGTSYDVVQIVYVVFLHDAGQILDDAAAGEGVDKVGSADLDRRMQNVRDVISKNVPKEEKIPFLGELI